MTRQPEAMNLLSSLGPLPPTQSRASELIDRLAGEIKGRRIEPGARLPTEQEMMSAFGVSRTVVREAVAALRAEGLVETRQGVGAFVSRDLQRRPFRIDPAAVPTIDDVLSVMELRVGIEIEAAGIAAERATHADKARLGRALKALDAALARGESSVVEDFEFHQAIAETTRNPQFGRFLEFLEPFLIPRRTIHIGLTRAQDLQTYLARIQREHQRIYQAICSRDATAARRAMREHLLNSRRRYERFAKAERSKNKPR
jgi:GntR family transcriptional regulator, transcriptional repressor for pyruvate dehydrogenase complex